MGAWGHGPFDSDQGWDMIEDLREYGDAYIQLWKTLGHQPDEEQAQYAACALVATATGCNGLGDKESVDQAINDIALKSSDWRMLATQALLCCQELADNKEYLETWNEPEKVKGHLKTIHKHLQTISAAS